MDVYVSDGIVYSEDEIREQYDDLICETAGPISILGCDYQAHYVLQQVDPIAYRCGFSNFLSDYEEHTVANDIEWEDIPRILGLED